MRRNERIDDSHNRPFSGTAAPRNPAYIVADSCQKNSIKNGLSRPRLESKYEENGATMNIDTLLDLMSDIGQRNRSETQMTLGKLIAALEVMPVGAEVINLNRPHSYRGYYCDLAFELGEGKRLAADMLAVCKSAMGKVFEGYKGGDYIMKESTPVWIAEYGCSGVKLMEIYEGGKYETEDDD